MKSLGITRRVDDLGRIVIPKETRTMLDMKIGDPIEFFIDGHNVVLRKYEPGCSYCGNTDTVAELGAIKLCAECKGKLCK